MFITLYLAFKIITDKYNNVLRKSFLILLSCWVLNLCWSILHVGHSVHFLIYNFEIFHEIMRDRRIKSLKQFSEQLQQFVIIKTRRRGLAKIEQLPLFFVIFSMNWRQIEGKKIKQCCFFFVFAIFQYYSIWNKVELFNRFRESNNIDNLKLSKRGADQKMGFSVFFLEIF